jgi:hypothetical protein
MSGESWSNDAAPAAGRRRAREEHRICYVLPEQLVAVVEALEVEELPEEFDGRLGAVGLDLRVKAVRTASSPGDEARRWRRSPTPSPRPVKIALSGVRGDRVIRNSSNSTKKPRSWPGDGHES